MSTTLRGIAALLVTIAIGASLHAEVIEQVLVKVNGDIITKTELEARQIAALRGQNNQDALKNEDELKKVLADITPQILVETIDEMLVVQLATERGYRLRDEQFNDWLNNLRKEQNLQDEEKFHQALKQEGMTIADLRKNVERQFMVSQVHREEIGSKLSITEEEARQYYLSHQQEFVEPATVTLREILIEIPTTNQRGQAALNVGQDDDARAAATAARGRVLGGEDFAKVAGEVSTAPSKANGGLIGPIAVSELSEALQKLIKTMKPGEVTPPLRTGRGYQILKLETLREAAAQSFDSVRDLVAERVHADRQRQEVRKFQSRLRNQAIIEWKNAELKKAYDRAVTEPAPAQ